MDEKKFDYNQKMTKKSLQEFLDTFFGNRKKYNLGTDILLKILEDLNMSFKDIRRARTEIWSFLASKEKEKFENVIEADCWAQATFVSRFLSIYYDSFWQRYQKNLPKSEIKEMEEWREEFKQKN